MTTEHIIRLKACYENGDDNIGYDLIRPCLKECVSYRRGTAFFSSSSLKSYADALSHIVKDKVRIEILCSPVINDVSLLNVLNENLTEEERLNTIQKYQEHIIRKTIIKFQEDPDHRSQERSALLAYLIANDLLIIKTAIRKSEGWPNPWPTEDEVDKFAQLYHVKRGYFVFDDGKKIAFDGSFNETDSGLKHNTETANVYKNWQPNDEFRARNIIDRVDRDWEEKNPYLHIRPLSKELILLIKTSSPENRPRLTTDEPRRPREEPQITPVKPERNEEDLDKWRHKDEALQVFVEKRVGILAMATGTGKTSTAIKIANYLFTENLIDSVIITMVGNSLLHQWVGELSGDRLLAERIILKHFSEEKQIQAYLNSPTGKLLVVTSDQLSECIRLIEPTQAARTLIIYDEVHNMAAPVKQSDTQGLHSQFNYRLGLSATPDRGEFDEEGTAFLFEEIGPIIYTFDLKAAISRGILVEFDYKALIFKLTDEENKKISKIIASQNLTGGNGKIKSEFEVKIAISAVKKQAENMLLSFRDYLTDSGLGCLERTIIFVHTKAYGDKITKIISDLGFTKYSTFYEDDNEINLKKLADNTIDCLITCHKLSQGIDIKSLNNVILFASSVGKLETSQRIGRVLRAENNNPTKRAFVLDFCVQDDGDEGNLKSDTKRMHWLTDLSKSKREES